MSNKLGAIAGSDRKLGSGLAWQEGALQHAAAASWVDRQDLAPPAWHRLRAKGAGQTFPRTLSSQESIQELRVAGKVIRRRLDRGKPGLIDQPARGPADCSAVVDRPRLEESRGGIGA